MFGQKIKSKEKQDSKELIGNAVVELRKSMKLTQQEFASKVGKPQSTIARIETGEMNPSILLIDEIARALNKKLNISFKPLGINGVEWVFPLELLEDNTEMINQKRKQAEKWAESLVSKFERFLEMKFKRVNFVDFTVTSNRVQFCYDIEFRDEDMSKHFREWGLVFENMLDLKNVSVFFAQEKLFINIQLDERLPISVPKLFEQGLSKAEKKPLQAILGESESGEAVTLDISEHSLLLVATGVAGSGSSVGVIDLIMSIMAHSKPELVNFAFIDPQKVEFNQFKGNPFLATDILVDDLKSYAFLEWACHETDRRSALLSSHEVNITEFNERIDRKEIVSEIMKPLIVVIDAYAALFTMTYGKILEPLKYLGENNAKEVGIHVIIITQYPTSDLIDLELRDFITGRWVFKMKDQISSEIALGMQGAERLLGYGDSMLCQKGTREIVRTQAAYIDFRVINRVNEYLSQNENDNSPMLEEAEYLGVAAERGVVKLISESSGEWTYKV